MKRTTTIALFYTGVALVSAAILAIAFTIRSRLPQPDMASIVDAGKETVFDWYPLRNDLEAVHQDGGKVKLSDLRGKVWIAAQFFAVCPHCAVRNGAELRKLYDEFKDHPDFHIVCITVDPVNDQQDKLREYAQALSADTADWWFLNAGDEATTHRYLEKEMKFFAIKERTDPADIEANGRFSHDLGFLLVDRDMQVIGKWPLADARSDTMRKLDPGAYDRLQAEMYARIRSELGEKTNP